MKEIRDINFEHSAVGTVTISNFRRLVSSGQIGCFMRRDVVAPLCFHLVRGCSDDSLRIIENVWSIEIINNWSTVGALSPEEKSPESLRQSLLNQIHVERCPKRGYSFINWDTPWRVGDQLIWLFMILTGTATTYARARSKDDLKEVWPEDEMDKYIAFPNHPDFSDGWISCNDSFISHDWPAIPKVKDNRIFEIKIAEADHRAETGDL